MCTESLLFGLDIFTFFPILSMLIVFSIACVISTAVLSASTYLMLKVTLRTSAEFLTISFILWKILSPILFPFSLSTNIDPVLFSLMALTAKFKFFFHFPIWGLRTSSYLFASIGLISVSDSVLG